MLPDFETVAFYMFLERFGRTSSLCWSRSAKSQPRGQFHLRGALTSWPLARTMASTMSQRLEGKTIVVTGASSGIGKSTGHLDSEHKVLHLLIFL